MFWSIQDGGGDVVALCDSQGAMVATGAQAGSGQSSVTVKTGRVVGQWVYGAYGEVLVAETIEDHPTLHLGHKGLFVDRLDEGITTSGTDPPGGGAGGSAGGGGAGAGSGAAESPRLVPFAVTLVYARNRSYSPTLGRWMQRDPNATGSPICGAALERVEPPDVGARHMDGGNLYEYLSCAPWTRADPTGLTPDRLIGPGWAQGGVRFATSPVVARASMASRGLVWAGQTIRSAVDGGVKAAGQELVIGAVQIAGAGLAHVLYGQDGPGGADVWNATATQIRRRAMKRAGWTDGALKAGAISAGVPKGAGDFYQASRSLWEGAYFEAGASFVDGLIGFIGEESEGTAFRSAAARAVHSTSRARVTTQ